jgi:hypothetical protein
MHTYMHTHTLGHTWGTGLLFGLVMHTEEGLTGPDLLSNSVNLWINLSPDAILTGAFLNFYSWFCGACLCVCVRACVCVSYGLCVRERKAGAIWVGRTECGRRLESKKLAPL